ncbi:hypothetical protein, partial [Silvanigrella sp.]|uniref:hypothetical protein n=1 Tax=Silvanigrella sp. TaxID=2024976 RepID=UPI0037C84A48
IGSIASAAGKKGTISITRSYSTASTASVRGNAVADGVSLGSDSFRRFSTVDSVINENTITSSASASITRRSSVASRSGISTYVDPAKIRANKLQGQNKISRPYYFKHEMGFGTDFELKNPSQLINRGEALQSSRILPLLKNEGWVAGGGLF